MINATWPWKLGGHMYVHEETINFFIMINILWNCDDPYEALHDDCQAGVYWPLACPPPLFQAALPPPVGWHQMVPHPNLPTASWNVGKGGEIEKALCGVFSSKKNMCFLSYNCSSVHRPIPFNAFEIVGEKGIFASSVPQTLEKRSASAFISSPERALWLGHAIKTLSTHNTHTWYLSPVPHAAQV